MSLESAVQRVGQLQSLLGLREPAPPPEPQPATPGAFARSLQRASSTASVEGLPAGAWTLPAPSNGSSAPDPALLTPRQQAAQIISQRFGLQVTSSYRDPEHNAAVGGVPGSLHTRGLAFDLVGSGAQMEAARRWAAAHPEMFQEVLVHDAGSGMHLHLGFRSA